MQVGFLLAILLGILLRKLTNQILRALWKRKIDQLKIFPMWFKLS